MRRGYRHTLGTLGVKFWDIWGQDNLDMVTTDFAASNMVHYQTFASTDRFCINAPSIAQGNQARLGDNIRLKNAVIRGHIVWNGFSASPDSASNHSKGTVYIAAILDKQNNGTGALAGNDVYTLPSGGTVQQRDAFQRNLANTDRYRVLGLMRIHDTREFRTIHNGVDYYVSTQGDQSSFEWILKLDGIKTKFAPGASTPSAVDIKDNAIKLMAWGTSSNSINYRYYSRLHFFDD